MTEYTRRQAVGLMAATAGLATCPLQAFDIGHADGFVPLRDLAARKGIAFGSAAGVIGKTPSFNSPEYREILKRECGILVAENAHKWPSMQPEEGHFNFRRADQMVEFAEDNGMTFRGHNLVWHHMRWLPKWVKEYDFGPNPVKAAERLIENQVRSVCGHYGARIHSWDVVNETIEDDTGRPRQSVFTEHLGQEVIDLAFHTAREAAPHAQLVYNDYMSWERHSARHRDGVLRLLEGLLKRGVPVDALGIQGHIGTQNTDQSTGFDSADEREWRKFLDEVTGMGLDLLLTEFDVHDKGLPADHTIRDEEVAGLARRYMDLTLSYKEVTDVLVWGMVDHFNWLQYFWPRSDGIAKRPTLYDSNFRPKLLRDALASAFEQAPDRRQKTIS